MALQLILGGSGSGKTTYLYDEVIRLSMEHPQEQYFLIVPEQFTMQTQKDIVTRHPNHGTMNIDIVSFARLAYRIFEELAVEQLSVLDDMGKSMVLRKVAAAQKRQLVLFGGQLSKPGFVGQLKSMLSEFYQYGITPEALREMAPSARSPLLRQKLEDLALVEQSFQEYIEGHYITTEQVLDVLCRLIPESGLIRNSVIALDGYTGFTPVQYRLTELFLVYAKQVYVTVTADEAAGIYGKMGIQNLFYMSRQMAVRLSEIAEKNQVKKLPDIILGEQKNRRFARRPELAWLEQNLFRYGTETAYTGEATDSIVFFQASNPSGEVSHIVHEIQRLVQEGKARYREIAVITGDLPGYGKEITHQFTQNQIPHFMDDKKNVLDNCLVELIRASLEAVRQDFSYESVMRYLRTGLVSQERTMVDRLENYILAMGIRGGKRFRETWERTYRGAGDLNVTEVNAFKDRVLAPLFAMQERFRQADLTIAGMTEAVLTLLADCRAEEQLESYQEYFTKIGEHRLAKEYGQVYGLVTELLKRLSDLLGEERVSRKEYLEILDAGFAELKVGVIPAVADRVVVGDITRTRLAHIRVLFFAGVNDGIVPARKERGSLLSDRDRDFLGEHHLELAPTAREESFQQRFYLYLMMTKPSKQLILSWCRTGADGKSRRPSFLIGELRAMFPDAVLTDQETQMDSEIYSVAEAKQRLSTKLGQYRDGQLEQDEEKAQFLELYRWFASSKDNQKILRRFMDAAFFVYEQQGISHAVAKALYGEILSGSVTRLEQYAACAYSHFLRYGLELLERKRFELASSDIGTLFHESIDLCFRRVKEKQYDWHTMTNETRDMLVEECVAAVTENYGNTILGSSARNRYLAQRVGQITKRTVWALQQQIKKGDFIPTGFEVSFSAADNLSAMKIALSESEALHLRGRIDRMDVCEDGGKVYVKIIDYKSGSTSFDLLALYYGLQLQLVVYMDAVTEMAQHHYPDKEIVPAGILYYNIADPLAEKKGQPDPEKIDAEILKKLRMNGLVNSELEVVRHLDRTIEKESDVIPVVLKDGEVQAGRSSVANRERFARLSQFVHRKLKEAGQEILDGEIGVAPYKNGQRTACDYCPYHAVCGFDRKTSGYEFNRWKNRKTEEIWEEICREQQ
ncbi:helicase-exonuclease AddAB subunit AddB [Clostridium sp. AM33-3]|uniref:helicase-exonuclease AddAB subunit AddB n=1 Tax=Clostridium sp. AM33-3 TaxID=2292304 RepID=UPI000E47D716|nr:helicase-exonuclease AddAB subunit AddB [Clostridium sp. AM33-3]RHT21983.1 helicase-exonuclease AddAB subunit AddB [Clostridium sp. AM33-3]